MEDLRRKSGWVHGGLKIFAHVHEREAKIVKHILSHSCSVQQSSMFEDIYFCEKMLGAGTFSKFATPCVDPPGFRSPLVIFGPFKGPLSNPFSPRLSRTCSSSSCCAST